MSKPTVKTKPISSNSDGSQKLIPISLDTFKRDSAKTLYSKIRQYVNLIGQNGTIDKEFRIMSEKSSIPDSNYFLNKDADVFMTIKRADKDLHINLTRRTVDKSNNMVLLEATLNKDGQMINGRYPLHHLTFERYGANVRRMKKYGEQYLPIAENDREWDFCGKRLTGSPSDIRSINGDDCVGGAFEVFMELARLHTSVLK